MHGPFVRLLAIPLYCTAVHRPSVCEYASSATWTDYNDASVMSDSYRYARVGSVSASCAVQCCNGVATDEATKQRHHTHRSEMSDYGRIERDLLVTLLTRSTVAIDRPTAAAK